MIHTSSLRLELRLHVLIETSARQLRLMIVVETSGMSISSSWSYGFRAARPAAFAASSAAIATTLHAMQGKKSIMMCVC